MKHRLPITLLLLVGVVIIIAGQRAGRAQSEPALKAQCRIKVPLDWGEFVGASSYGLGFRDNQGTIRFVSQMSCNLDGPPNISLQIKRQ